MSTIQKPSCGRIVIYHPVNDIQGQANNAPHIPGIVVQAFDSQEMFCNLQVFPDSDQGSRQRVSVPHVSAVKNTSERYWRWHDEEPYGAIMQAPDTYESEETESPALAEESKE